MATNVNPTAVNLSNNQDIDALLWGWRWGSGTALDLTFSFPATVAANTVGEYTNYVEIDNFSAFNATQQAAVRTAHALISSYCNLTFTETTNTGATFRFGNVDKINYTNDNTVATFTGLHAPGNAPGTAEGAPPQLAFNSTPPTVPTYAQGDAWFVTNGYTNPVLGSFQETAGVFHEIGHTLGLKHGHVTQGGHGVTFPALPADHNSYEYSIMTYQQFPTDTINLRDNAPDHPTTYMQDDIAALQYLYGAHYAAGAHTYTWSPTTGEESIDGVGQGAPQSNFVLMTVWDGGGNATYNFSNYTTNLSVNLNPGQWTILDTSAAHAQRADLGNNGATPTPGPEYFARGNIANALIDPNNPNETTSLIRNVVGGSGDDTIVGNAADNTIDGGGGTNTAVYSGARSDYTATLENNGSIQVADNRAGSPDGTDTDTNIQLFKFSDRTYNTIELLNHAPVLSSDTGSPHNDTEIFPGFNLDTPHPFSGTLSFTDVDAGDTHTPSQSLKSETWSGGASSSIPQATLTALAAAMSDSISLDSTATTPGTLSWSFSLADKYLDFLAKDETLTVVYDVTVADHHTGSTVSATSTVPVTFVFTGTNDDPVFQSAQSTLTGTVNEQPNVTGSSTPDTTPSGNKIAFSDPDLNDRPTGTIDTAHQTVTWQDATHDFTSQLTAAQIASLEAAFSIKAEAANTNTGAIDWTYSIVDSNLDFLGVGETLTITTPVVIDDHNGGKFTENVVVTAIGANDPPIASPDSNGTPKGSTLTVSSANGVFANDTDPDAHDQGHLVVSAVDGSAANVGNTIAGTYGSLTLNGDGSYVYVANRGSLPAQIVAQDTFNYTVADPHGGTDTSTLSIVVFNPGVSYQAGIKTTLIGGDVPNVLDGSAGHDILIGGNASDVLIGGNGDTLTGNNGPDTFLFRPNFGANTITDLNVTNFNNDAIQLDKSIFTSVTDMLNNHTVDTAGGAVITDAHGDTITLVGVTVAQLQAHANLFHLV